jgi:hypothetical protein
VLVMIKKVFMMPWLARFILLMLFLLLRFVLHFLPVPVIVDCIFEPLDRPQTSRGNALCSNESINHWHTNHDIQNQLTTCASARARGADVDGVVRVTAEQIA